MENYPLFIQLQQEIQHNFLDIKAESLLAMALESGLTEDDFIIACDSLFSRTYDRDVLFSMLEKDANRNNYLQIHVSRNGIYDQLPEGLFYQPVKSKQQGMSAADMAEEYKLNKQKEKEVRKFFMPFENAFFRQQMHLEKEEVQLLEGLQCGVLNEYFVNFWGISPAIPQLLITPLIELLPYASKIAGNLTITAQCLEKVLQEEITVRRLSAPVSKAEAACILSLGTGRLGVDMVLGEQFEEDFPVIECTIGPLQHSQVHDYLEGGNREQFLKTFYQFFMPVEADVITRIEPAANTQYLIFDTDEPVLGYSSILCEL